MEISSLDQAIDKINMLKQLRYLLEFFLAKLLLGLTAVLPESWVYHSVDFIAMLFHRWAHSRNRIIDANLCLAFPELDRSQRVQLRQNIWKHFSEIFWETLLLFSQRLGTTRIRQMIDVDPDLYRQLIDLRRDRSRGAVLVTAHFGHWELLANYFAIEGMTMSVIGRAGDNPWIERYITAPLREQFGNKLIHKDNAMMEVPVLLQHGEWLGILADQKVRRREGVEVQFFGHPVTATLSPALFAARYRAKVLFLYLARSGRQRYRLLSHAPPELNTYPGRLHERLTALTQDYFDHLEQLIRLYPEQWFWMHNRWKLVSKKIPPRNGPA